ncbi:MAG: hypothetical protein O7E57_09330, partial [Gammaproteobacteria bacterium]|nr:hypothetical protein [Gammaproteobacteria bacterium]
MVKFGKLLKGKDRLGDADPEIRRRAIQELNPQKGESLQAELADLAQHDSDIPVRLACVEKLTEPDLLGVLLDQPALTQAAATRIATLMGAGNPCSFAGHPLVLRERLLIAGSDEEVKELIEEITHGISDLEILLDLVLRAKQELREPLLAL